MSAQRESRGDTKYPTAVPEQPRQAPHAGPRRPPGMLFFVIHGIYIYRGKMTDKASVEIQNGVWNARSLLFL